MKTIKLIFSALILLAITLPACKNKGKNAVTAPTTPVTETVDTLPEPAAVAPDSSQAVMPDTVPVVNKEEAVAIKQDNKLNAEDYYVIGGSFKELARATKFAANLKAKGYQSQVLKPAKGFNRVAIRAYETQTKARAELTKLRKDFNDVSYWLLLPTTK